MGAPLLHSVVSRSITLRCSELRYDFDVGEPGPWFSDWSLGDGQAYVMIALDPSGGIPASTYDTIRRRPATALLERLRMGHSRWISLARTPPFHTPCGDK